MNDANIKNGNWNKSTGEKDWMLRLGIRKLLKQIQTYFYFQIIEQANIYLHFVLGFLKIIKKNMNDEMWNYKEEASIRTSLNNRKML